MFAGCTVIHYIFYDYRLQISMLVKVALLRSFQCITFFLIYIYEFNKYIEQFSHLQYFTYQVMYVELWERQFRMLPVKITSFYVSGDTRLYEICTYYDLFYTAQL